MFGLTDRVGRAAMRAVSLAAFGLAALPLGATLAQAETRVLKFYHLHTHEKVSIAYKKDGRYIPEGMKKINWELRDWRRSQPIKVDPRLLDLIWEAYRQSGSSEYINVVCGYRAPATNSMLRSRSSGVAKESQHMLGRALDFFIPGVPLKKMREIGLRMQVGGVGYYPRSGSPFVHFDVGSARHWPRMSRQELLAVFPKGGTVHVPSDGKPLPGYLEALASYKKRKGDSSIQVANAGASSSSASRSGGGKTLFAVLFGGGADEEEDVADVAMAENTPAPAAKKIERPAPTSKPQGQIAVAALVPAAKPKLLPPGVPLPIRDTFDMSAPVPPVGFKEKAEETEVASLAMSRIPLPRSAPQRTILTPVVPLPSEALVAEKDEVSALVASLASSPEAEEIAAGAAGQLAYSVPTPRNRPPFASILRDPAPATSGVAPASVDEIRRIVDAGDDAASVPNVLATTRGQAVPIPAMMNAAFPAERPAVGAPARQSLAALMAAVAMPTGRPAGTTGKQGRNLLVASFDRPQKPLPTRVKWDVPAGKTGRFTRSGPAAAEEASQARPQAAGGRVELASLVADPNSRAAKAVLRKPDAGSLVRDVPTSVFTAGFARQPLGNVSDRFAGSAVNFLPVAKFD